VAKPTELIKQIQELQLAIESRMDEALPRVFAKLSDQVIDLASDLSLDPKDRAKSLKELIKLKKDIANTIITNAPYQLQVAEVIKGFEMLAELSNEYITIAIVILNQRRHSMRQSLKLILPQQRMLY
jgi:hypothetical protein